MATTQEIISAAEALGKLIAQHDTVRKFESAVKKLEGDVAAQRAMDDLNRHLAVVAQKESQGKPIEVEDKRKLERLQEAVIGNEVLRAFQVAQMDYLDLMRKVDEAVSRSSLSPDVAAMIGGEH